MDENKLMSIGGQLFSCIKTKDIKQFESTLNELNQNDRGKIIDKWLDANSHETLLTTAVQCDSLEICQCILANANPVK